MQLSKNSPIYQCQGKASDGQQCQHQAVGYRRYRIDGDLYHACRIHIHNNTFEPHIVNSPAPVFPASGKAGQTSAGKNWR